MAGAKRKPQRRSSVTIEEYRPSIGTGRYSDRIAISPYATTDPKSEAMKESFVGRRKPRVQRTSARARRRRTGSRA